MKKPLEEEHSFSEIASMIRSMPDLDPPPDLLPSVMQSIRAVPASRWRRAWKWIRTPRAFTFTPLQAGGAAAVLAACLAFFLLLPGMAPVSPTVPEANGRIPVRISVAIPDARSVSVVGNFNNWRAQECEVHEEDGRKVWTVTLMLPEGRYEYGFLVDGRKIVPDPLALILEDDGFGNTNSVLVVGQDEKTT
ncbi:MAG: glycogen-binding domain-containing protein [Syntrophobacteraceae bacterium]